MDLPSIFILSKKICILNIFDYTNIRIHMKRGPKSDGALGTLFFFYKKIIQSVFNDINSVNL